METSMIPMSLFKGDGRVAAFRGGARCVEPNSR